MLLLLFICLFNTQQILKVKEEKNGYENEKEEENWIKLTRKST